LVCLLFASSFAASQQSSCSLCTLVVGYVESYLQQNATEAEIVLELEQVCSLLGPLADQCKQIVDQYVPQIVEWLVNGNPPATACAHLGLCSSPKIKAKAGPTCDICEMVIQYVESYIQDNQTEAQIAEQLDQICALLGPLEQPCDAMVAQYLPQMIKWIVDGNPPAAFCASLGLCSSPRKQVVEITTQKRSIQQGGCSVCELVVTYIDSFLKSNASEEEIIQQLDQVCSLLGPLESQCDQFVALYVPQAIQWILNGETPSVFCSQVGLCAARKPKVTTHVLVKSDSVCSICETVATLVESYIASSTTEKEVEDELALFCSSLPAPFDEECTNLVATYLPQVVGWIVKHETPAVVCGYLELC